MQDGRALRRWARLWASVVTGCLALVLLGGTANAASTVVPSTGRIDSCGSVTSPNGQHVLTMQCGGDLVLTHPGGRVAWTSGTSGDGNYARMRSTGRLTVFTARGTARWSSASGGSGATLHLQDDGNLVVYRRDGRPAWASGTVYRPPATTTAAPPTTVAPTSATAPPTTSTSPTTPSTTTTTPASTPAAQVVAATNVERRRAGCAPLTAESRLTAAAQGHAADMAANRYFSHTSQDGRTFRTRIEAAGYTGWRRIAENIARGQTTAQQVVDAWMASPGHRANIVNCALTEIGVGYDSRGHYWVQNFGTR